MVLCKGSRVDVLAKIFRLALNRYIAHESANIKLCQYQVMVSNGLFEKTTERFSLLQLITFYISFT